MDKIEVITVQEGDVTHFGGLSKSDIGSYAIYMHKDDSLMMVDERKDVIDDFAGRLAFNFDLDLIHDMTMNIVVECFLDENVVH